ncbi:MAG: hypothetical protein AAF567_11780 [Actinomycetota bacterium]
MRFQLGVWGAGACAAVWDTGEHPHGIVTGQTGSGKSFLLGWLIEQATADAEVWIGDGKASGEFASCGDVVAGGPIECVELCEQAAGLIADRQAGFDRPLLVVIDEAAAITLRVAGDQAKDARDRKDRFLSSLSSIALMGRSVGVHLVVALQRADADVLGGATRDQFGFRVALGWSSPDGYRMVLGESQLQPPTNTPGEGWAVGLSGAPPEPVPLFVDREPVGARRWWRR